MENKEGKQKEQGKQIVEEEDLKGKILLLEEKIKECEKRAENYLTQLKYLQADFENYRKMFEAEVSRRVMSAKEGLILALIPIKEDLERAIQAAGEDSPLLKGVKMVAENFKAVLAKEGLEEIEALGAKFDPNLHEALSYVSKEDSEDGVITAVIRKGYKLGGKVIRASLVEVNKRRTEAQDYGNIE
ncbi:MAG: nucleotide exchange factor GrpE [Thaumarchaeota archaeon]|nr:nucleotide exchange factor GrpE [Nitrososphaerota archaeon]